MVDKAVLASVKKLIEILKQNDCRIKKVILYGSYADGSFREYSDIDIALISDDFGKDKVEEKILLLRLASHIDPRLEPVPLSTKTYENDTWIPLVYEIRNRGVELTEKLSRRQRTTDFSP